MRSSTIVGNKIIYKILTLGESDVGKTSLLNFYIEEKFNPHHFATVGIDYRIKTIEINSNKIDLQIWDTAGQERYRNITNQYYKNSDGILLVFDLTNHMTFEKINDWIKQIYEHLEERDICVLLVGNKADLKEREVTDDEIKEIVDESQFQYFKTSAKTGQNVKECFETLCQNIYDKKTGDINSMEEMESMGISLDGYEDNSKSGKCC